MAEVAVEVAAEHRKRPVADHEAADDRAEPAAVPVLDHGRQVAGGRAGAHAAPAFEDVPAQIGSRPAARDQVDLLDLGLADVAYEQRARRREREAERVAQAVGPDLTPRGGIAGEGVATRDAVGAGALRPGIDAQELA